MIYEDEPLPPRLDWDALAKSKPSPPELLMEGLPKGQPTGVFGDGGLGKSYEELTRAVCISAERDFFDVPLRSRTESVLYLSCEDPESVLHFRIANICRYFEIDMTRDLDLDVLDMTERDAVLFDPRAANGPLTPAYQRLQRYIQGRSITTLFIDGIANTFAGDENSRGEVTRYVTAMHNLVRPSRPHEPWENPGTVVLIGHVNKMTAGNPVTTHGYSGSTAFHNRLRNRWFVRPEVEDGRRTGKVIYDLQKSITGELGMQMEFEWSDAHKMFIGQKRDGASQSDRPQNEADTTRGILRALKGCMEASPPIVVPRAINGPETAYQVLSRRPEFPAELRRDTPQVRRRVNSLLRDHRAAGDIEEKPYTRANRKAGTQIVLTEKGARQCA